MGTKSKNIRFALRTKLLAVFVSVLAALLAAHGLLAADSFHLAVDQADYAESNELAQQLAELGHRVERAALYYRNEDHIRSGQSSASEIEAYARRPRSDHERLVAQLYDQYAAWISGARDSSTAERLTAERDERIAHERTLLDNQIAAIQAERIEQHLIDYRKLVADLNRVDAYFHVSQGENAILSNIGVTIDPQSLFSSLPAKQSSTASNGSVVVVGFSQAKFDQLAADYNVARTNAMRGVYQFFGGLLVFMLGFGYLCYSAGRRPDEDGIHLTALDRPYLDISLGTLFVAFFFNAYFAAGIARHAIVTSSQVAINLLALLVIIAALLVLLGGTLLAKRLKRGEVMSHTLIYRLAVQTRCFFEKIARQVLSAGPLGLRLGLLQTAYVFTIWVATLMAAWARNAAPRLLGILIFIGINGIALLYVLRKSGELQAITAGVLRIQRGELSHQVVEPKYGTLNTLAHGVNSIALGLKAAVNNEVKSERMKAELITNVSHDLKTPLTSLITYVDLLKREGLSSENAPKYLEVLDKKSQRLKSLTEDLFEAAKAASGSIKLQLETLEIGSLLTQGLGELQDKIDQSGLDFRLNLPTEKLYVRADGKQLWRVVENLLSNVFKYALPGSRVYIEATRHGSRARVAVKNISACELNINPDELMERFKRGDESRHSEGSGLGLAIAKSLIELQEGDFRIEIDGDLFKAVVELPLGNPGHLGQGDVDLSHH